MKNSPKPTVLWIYKKICLTLNSTQLTDIIKAENCKETFNIYQAAT